jgi:phosphopantothenoylcysteine decarboxylase/phosphopantothenate--cysteine ligase
MGVAIAESAWRRGATVTLIAGPLEVGLPADILVTHVESAAEMGAAIERALPQSDVLIMAAAPADFRPRAISTEKIKRGNGTRSFDVEATADILISSKAQRRPGAVIVGFALETGAAVDSAQRKLVEKGLDLIVANDATEPGAGFSVDTNRVTLLEKDGRREDLPLLPKTAVADEILDRVERLRRER